MVLKLSLDQDHLDRPPPEATMLARAVESFGGQHTQITLRKSHRFLQADIGAMFIPHHDEVGVRDGTGEGLACHTRQEDLVYILR